MSTVSLEGWVNINVATTEEDHLFHDLFRNYLTFVRPVENFYDSVNIGLELFISQLVKVVSAIHM